MKKSARTKMLLTITQIVENSKNRKTGNRITIFQNKQDVKLSEGLKAFAQKEVNQINLAFKNISLIDNVPKKYSSIESLDLRGNILTTIKGISQFPKLVHLNLATNNIMSLENLLFLKDLQSLRWLSLEDNPIKDQSNYMYTIITLLPNLQYLDGIKISESLKKESQENLQQQEQMLEILLKNYLELISLNNALKKINLHEELRTEYNFSQDTPPFCIEKFQRYFKLQRIFENFDQDICTELKISLLNDAHLILKEPSNLENLNDAFEELRTKQSQKKLEIIDKIEGITKQQSTQFFKQRAVTPHSQNVYKEVRSMSATKKSNSLSRSGSLPRSNSQRKIANNSQLSIQNQENLEQSQNKQYQTHNTNNSQINMSVMSNGANQSKKLLNSSSHKVYNQINQSSFYSNSRINNSLNTMNKFTKMSEFANHPSNCLKLRNSDKDTLICQLSESLNAKIAELVKVEEINQRLRVEINDQCAKTDNLYSDLQNQIIFKEEQIKNCQEQMKGMEQSLKDTKQKMNVLIFQNYEMEQHKLNLEKSEQIIQNYNAAFQYQEFLEEKESFAKEYYNKRVLQYGLNCLKHATQRNKNVNEFQERIETKFMNNQGALFFKKWIEFTVKSQRIKHQQAIVDNTVTSTFFRQWRENVLFSKNLRVFRQNQKRRVEVETYCTLKDNMRSSKRFKLSEIQAIKFHQKKLKKAAFYSLKQYYSKYNIADKKEKIVAYRKAQNHYMLQKKKQSFTHWINFIRLWKQPMREKSRKSDNHFNQIIVAKSFQRWKILQAIRLQNEQKAELWYQRRQKKFFQKLLWKWKEDYHRIHVKKRAQASKIAFQLKVKYFKALQLAKSTREKKLEKYDTISAQVNLKRIIKVIKSLKINVQMNRKAEKRAAQLIQSKELAIVRNIFQNYKIYCQKQKLVNDKIKKVELIVQQKFFTKMQKKAKRIQNRKEKSLALKSQHKFKKEKHFSNVFQQWKSFVFRQKRNRRLVEKADLYRKQRIFHYLVLGIKDQNISVFKRRIIEQQLIMNSLDDRCNENIRYANDADTKQIDYINKLDLLSQNIDFLKSEIEEKDVFIQSLKQNISQKNEEIDVLQSKFMISQTENREIVKKLTMLDNELVNKVSKYEQTIAELKDQYAILNNNVLQMQSDYEMKERGHKEQYGALSIKNASQDNYIAKLEQIKVDLEERCIEAETFAANQKQENQDLLIIVQDFDDERHQYKQKIEECLKVIEENSTLYEKKLIELKDEKNNLETENIVFQEKNQRQENEILDLKSDLRRMEYQLEMMISEQHKSTLQFIHNLNNNNNNGAVVHNNNTNNIYVNKNISSSPINSIANTNANSNNIAQTSQEINYGSSNNRFKTFQTNYFESVQQIYDTQTTPHQPLSSKVEHIPYDSGLANNFLTSRAAVDERQIHSKVVNIQDFLRPKRQDISPLKSYLINKRDKSQDKKEDLQQQHIYILPSSSQKTLRQNRISITSPTHYAADMKQETHNFTSTKSQATTLAKPHQTPSQQDYFLSNTYHHDSSKTPFQNVTTIDSIQKEVRNMKANTSSLKQNIERRLQNLNQNLDTDILTIKQQRLNSQSEELHHTFNE